MQKRISALLLAMVIVIGSVLGGNTLFQSALPRGERHQFSPKSSLLS